MYFIWLFIVTAFWTIIFGIAVILASPFDFKNGKILGYIVRCWSKTIFKTMGIKTKITGLENLEISKNYIFASNHASSLDIPLLLGFLPFWIVPISKIELKWVPFLGWAMQAAGHVFVDRRDHNRAMLSIEKINKSLLKTPRSILIFPEGSRTNNGDVKRFKSGGLSLGISTQMPIVPIRVGGTFESLNKSSTKFIKKLLTIKIGCPIETKAFKNKDRKKLTKIVYNEVKKIKNECT